MLHEIFFLLLFGFNFFFLSLATFAFLLDLTDTFLRFLLLFVF